MPKEKESGEDVSKQICADVSDLLLKTCEKWTFLPKVSSMEEMDISPPRRSKAGSFVSNQKSKKMGNSNIFMNY